MSRMIMDAGPLVAWLCRKDAHHRWALDTLRPLPAASLTCEAVLTEACHLVAKDGVDPGNVLEMVGRGALLVVPLNEETGPVRSLMAKYRDIGMDFADACVVRLAELHEDATVCTTDSDFKVYRRHGRREIPLLAPWG